MGDRRQTEVALDKGRTLLDTLPYPENLDHHFVVDPMKFDYYATDCYRTVDANSMAGHLAEEVIEASTDFDGRERAPMRMAEARITLGVVRAREGDLEGTVTLGTRALRATRNRALQASSADARRVVNPYRPDAREISPNTRRDWPIARITESPASTVILSDPVGVLTLPAHGPRMSIALTQHGDREPNRRLQQQRESVASRRRPAMSNVSCAGCGRG